MKKLTCIIVEDEPFAQQLLSDYIKKTDFLELSATFNNGISALSFLEENYVNLIFLDIQMPDITGIELSKLIDSKTKIIFTTAFSEYALEGFKVNAIGYLLKPFDFNEFYSAASKAKEWFILSENKKTDKNESNYIFVKSEYKQIKIELDSILYIEGLKDYVKIWIEGQVNPTLSLISLKHLEAELPNDRFMRVHRSFIVALDKIQAIERGQILINKERITVAEQYKENFNSFIKGRSI